MNSINLKGKVWMRLLFKKLQKHLTMYDMNKTSYKNNLRNNLIMWIVNQNLFSYFTYWLIIVHFTKSFVSLSVFVYIVSLKYTLVVYLSTNLKSETSFIKFKKYIKLWSGVTRKCNLNLKFTKLNYDKSLTKSHSPSASIKTYKMQLPAD